MDLCEVVMSLISDERKRQRAWALRREGYLKLEFRSRLTDLETRLIKLENLLRLPSDAERLQDD